MRYTQYTHKVSIPMRKELYDFLSDLPRGTRTDMGRQFFIYVHALLTNSAGGEAYNAKEDLKKLCRGNYIIYFPEQDDEKYDYPKEESDET